MENLKINLSNGTIDYLGNIYSIKPFENYKTFISRIKTELKFEFKEEINIEHPAEEKAIIMPMHLSEEINGMEVYPTVLITFTKHKKEIRAYMDYIVTGLNYSQKEAFEFIAGQHISFYKSCENFARQFSDNLFHY